jgi:hypothetical protein
VIKITVQVLALRVPILCRECPIVRIILCCDCTPIVYQGSSIICTNTLVGWRESGLNSSRKSRRGENVNENKKNKKLKIKLKRKKESRMRRR